LIDEAEDSGVEVASEGDPELPELGGTVSDGDDVSSELVEAASSPCSDDDDDDDDEGWALQYRNPSTTTTTLISFIPRSITNGSNTLLNTLVCAPIRGICGGTREVRVWASSGVMRGGGVSSRHGWIGGDGRRDWIAEGREDVDVGVALGAEDPGVDEEEAEEEAFLNNNLQNPSISPLIPFVKSGTPTPFCSLESSPSG
jgi:hypothetical protein